MNRLKTLNDSELTSLKQVITETYVGYIISTKHGIIHIGDTKNEISNLEEKIVNLENRLHVNIVQQTTQSLIKENEDKLIAKKQLLADIYTEVNASYDPRSMLNLPTLKVSLANTIGFQTAMITKQRKETSQHIIEIQNNSIERLGTQIKAIELIIALMKD